MQQISITYEYSEKRQQFFREAIQTNLAAAEFLGNKKKIYILCETRGLQEATHLLLSAFSLL